VHARRFDSIRIVENAFVHARRFDSIRIVENAFVHARRFDSDIRFEIVESAKLLGVIISNNLTWHAHIKEVVKKASKKLYYLVQLKRARLPAKDLVLFYTSCVRSVMDYAVPAFYHSLPQYLKNELIRLEKMGYFNNKSRNGLLCNRRNFERQTNRRTP
jgi:hypothetical protein